MTILPQHPEVQVPPTAEELSSLAQTVLDGLKEFFLI